KYRFDADATGVSAIKLNDAINITNNALEVNLGSLVLPLGGKLLLFDGDQALAGNRLFGTFASVTVNGAANPASYSVVYDQVHGDIFLSHVPEPGSALLAACSIALGLSAKRRAA